MQPTVHTNRLSGLFNLSLSLGTNGQNIQSNLNLRTNQKATEKEELPERERKVVKARANVNSKVDFAVWMELLMESMAMQKIGAIKTIGTTTQLTKNFGPSIMEDHLHLRGHNH